MLHNQKPEPRDWGAAPAPRSERAGPRGSDVPAQPKIKKKLVDESRVRNRILTHRVSPQIVIHYKGKKTLNFK